jgi:TRAP-type C4-dicarboxylate transport system substrate-binding protein
MVKSLAALAAVAVLGVLAAPPGEARAEEASLKAGFYSTSQKSQFRLAFNAFVDHVNETGEGKLGIDTVVDTAAIPRDQMPQALKDGIVDIIAVPPSVLDKLVPGMGALSAARVSTAEMRANGTFDLVNEYLAGAANARLVGLYAGDLPFHIFTSKPVRSLEDFKGLRLRGTNTNREAFTALGAQPLQVGRSEIYTSMQRGVIDGYANINNELWASSWVEVAKYRVDPGFFAPNIAIFVNLDRWNAMTPEQQEILSAAGVFVEGAPTQAMVAAEEADAERAVKEAGFEIIALPEADAQKFLDTVYGAQWDAIVANAPDLAAKLRPKIAE